MTVNEIQFFSVPVSDALKAQDFYTRTLGFTTVVDNRNGPHGRFIVVAPPGAATGIVLLDFEIPDSTVGKPAQFQLTCSDVDAETERLRTSGVSVEGPVDMPWGRSASLADPDGNRIGLLQPRNA